MTTKVRILRFTPQMMMSVTKGTFEVVENTTPQDASIEWSYYDPTANQFCIVISSEEFSEVPDGAIIPDFPAPVMRGIKK